MAHHIDWDNIHLHIHDNDVRYKRRLCRKQLYITCSPSIIPAHATTTSTSSLTTAGNGKTKGVRENGQSLVCKVDDVSSDDVSLNKLGNVNFLCDDDFWVECSNAVGNPQPIELDCGTRAHSDLKMDIKDFKIRRNVVDPDYKIFVEDLKVDEHSFALNVKNMDGSIQFLKYEKDELCKENQRKMKAYNVKNVLGNSKGDAAKNLKINIKKRKRDKVVPRVDVKVVSTKEKSNAMVRKDGFSRNSNRCSVAKRSSVVKRGDDMEIIYTGKPKEIEEVAASKIHRHSKIIKNKRPLKMDDGHNLEYLRRSKKQYEKFEGRLCLTRTDHVSNLMDIAGREKRHPAVLSRKCAEYQRTTSRNKWKDLVVRQGEDIESLRSSSGIGHMDVMVKEERFDDSTNVVLDKKCLQMIDERDSVYDNNLRPRYKCGNFFGKYAEVKEENAKSLNYVEEDNEDSSDLEILDRDNQQDLRKFEVTKVFNASVIEDNPLSMKISSDYETSVFREELMDILKRPYNLEEYRSLMQKAKYRHLNWGPEYSDGLKGKKVPNTYGKSPLDYHPDVQRRLRRCRKISKRLNILRGFIYWYGRTCQDGAFKPWLDKSCLAVSPCSR